MTKNFEVAYSEEAKNDLKILYNYIAYELQVPGIARNLIDLIRKEIRSLSNMPLRHVVVEWEPWASLKVHKLPVKNHIVFYIVDEDISLVTVVRILYAGRNIEHIVNVLDS